MKSKKRNVPEKRAPDGEKRRRGWTPSGHRWERSGWRCSLSSSGSDCRSLEPHLCWVAPLLSGLLLQSRSGNFGKYCGEVSARTVSEHQSMARVSRCGVNRQRMGGNRMSKNGRVSKNGKQTGALADPSQLRSMDQDDDAIIQVVIETPKGSRNKYAFDHDQRVFELKKVLPAGMTFPYDFGFVPRTLADGGDTVDVLLLMDEPEFRGSGLTAGSRGIIEGAQRVKKL